MPARQTYGVKKIDLYIMGKPIEAVAYLELVLGGATFFKILSNILSKRKNKQTIKCF